MTIDEAIKYNLDIADRKDKCADISVSEHAKERMRECAARNRQLAEWLTELKEAKRLLKMAVEDFSNIYDHILDCDGMCDTCPLHGQRDNCLVWQYADAALKLIGGSENE